MLAMRSVARTALAVISLFQLVSFATASEAGYTLCFTSPTQCNTAGHYCKVTDPDLYICELVPIGSYSTSNSGIAVPCGSGKTTSEVGTNSVDLCICDTGYGLVQASCTACESNVSYKTAVGNVACTPCVDNTTGCGGTSAGTCSAGYGTTDNGATCTACVAGKYKKTVGDDACTPCVDNTTGCGGTLAGTCKAGYDTTDSGATCTACVAGKFKASTDNKDSCTVCEAGKFSTLSTASTTCTTCEPGSTTTDILNDETEHVSLTSCNQCEAGYFKSSGTPANNCSPCLAGTAKWSSVYSVACDDCAAGKYTLLSEANTFCTDCPSGTYASFTKRTTACDPVSAGNYASITVDGSAVNAYADLAATGQTECRNGWYNDNDVKQLVKGVCIEVPAGYLGWKNGAAVTSGATAISPCPVDTFKESAGAGDCEAVLPGNFASIDGSTYASSDATQQVPCPAGKFSKNGEGDCALCSSSNGYTSTESGSNGADEQQACVCKQGWGRIPTNSVDKKSTACVICPLGEYKTNIGDEVCTPCDVGKYSGFAEGECLNPEKPNACKGSSVDCKGIPAGYEVNVNAPWSIRPCDVGFYSAGTVQYDFTKIAKLEPREVTCQACDAGGPENAGYTTAQMGEGVGADAQSACVCNAGYGRAVSGDDSSPCNICPAGTYKIGKGDDACVLCEAGKFSTEVGAFTASVCKSCDNAAGTNNAISLWSAAGSTTCSQCGFEYTTTNNGGEAFTDSMLLTQGRLNVDLVGNPEGLISVGQNGKCTDGTWTNVPLRQTNSLSMTANALLTSLENTAAPSNLNGKSYPSQTTNPNPIELVSLTGSGSGALVTVTFEEGKIDTITVDTNNAGSDYAAGDRLFFRIESKSLDYYLTLKEDGIRVFCDISDPNSRCGDLSTVPDALLLDAHLLDLFKNAESSPNPFVDGTYHNVQLNTPVSQSNPPVAYGRGALATVVVISEKIASITVTNGGARYATGDQIQIAAGMLGPNSDEVIKVLGSEHFRKAPVAFAAVKCVGNQIAIQVTADAAGYAGDFKQGDSIIIPAGFLSNPNGNRLTSFVADNARLLDNVYRGFTPVSLVDGIYPDVALSHDGSSGTGFGAVFTVTVASGKVTDVSMDYFGGESDPDNYPGSGYRVGETLTIEAGVLDRRLVDGQDALMGSITTNTAPGDGVSDNTYTDVPLTCSFDGPGCYWKSILGGAGGAKATVTVSAGIISNIKITSQGNGYRAGDVLEIAAGKLDSSLDTQSNSFTTSGPIAAAGAAEGIYENVKIIGELSNGVRGTGAYATVTVNAALKITGITVTKGGTGYVIDDTITIPEQALGSSNGALSKEPNALLTSIVDNIDNGIEELPGPYEGVPIVSETGSGAFADVTIGSNGAVTAITVKTSGSGYKHWQSTGAKEVSIAVGELFNSGKLSTVSNALLTSIEGTPSGLDNGVYKDVSFETSKGDGSLGKATVTVTGNTVTGIQVTDSGSGYKVRNEIKIAACTLGLSGSLKTNDIKESLTTSPLNAIAGTYHDVELSTSGTAQTATATVVVDNDRFITSITPTSGGSGYSIGDKVTIAAGKLGSGSLSTTGTGLSGDNYGTFNPGTGCTVPTSNPPTYTLTQTNSDTYYETASIGSGAVFEISVIEGSVSGIKVITAGSNYAVGDSFVFKGFGCSVAPVKTLGTADISAVVSSQAEITLRCDDFSSKSDAVTLTLKGEDLGFPSDKVVFKLGYDINDEELDFASGSSSVPILLKDGDLMTDPQVPQVPKITLRDVDISNKGGAVAFTLSQAAIEGASTAVPYTLQAVDFVGQSTYAGYGVGAGFIALEACRCATGFGRLSDNVVLQPTKDWLLDYIHHSPQYQSTGTYSGAAYNSDPNARGATVSVVIAEGVLRREENALFTGLSSVSVNCVEGIYTNVALKGGSGLRAEVDVTCVKVDGVGKITAINVVKSSAGYGYRRGDQLKIQAALLGASSMEVSLTLAVSVQAQILNQASCVNAYYTKVALQGGSGSGLTGGVACAGDKVVSINVDQSSAGSGYRVGDLLYIQAGALGTASSQVDLQLSSQHIHTGVSSITLTATAENPTSHPYQIGDFLTIEVENAFGQPLSSQAPLTFILQNNYGTAINVPANTCVPDELTEVAIDVVEPIPVSLSDFGAEDESTLAKTNWLDATVTKLNNAGFPDIQRDNIEITSVIDPNDPNPPPPQTGVRRLTASHTSRALNQVPSITVSYTLNVIVQQSGCTSYVCTSSPQSADSALRAALAAPVSFFVSGLGLVTTSPVTFANTYTVISANSLANALNANTCVAGTFGPLDATPSNGKCLSCPLGTYSLISSVTCTVCLTGFTTAASGTANACDVCAPGYAGNANATPTPTCTEIGTLTPRRRGICAPGSYKDTASNGPCVLCPVGHFTATYGAFGCFPCADGYYADVIGSSVCKIVPEGSVASSYSSAFTVANLFSQNPNIPANPINLVVDTYPGVAFGSTGMGVDTLATVVVGGGLLQRSYTVTYFVVNFQSIIGDISLENNFPDGATDNTFSNIQLTGGSGSGAIADVTVSSNQVSKLKITSGGRGYVLGDVLTIPAGFANGVGAARTFTFSPYFLSSTGLKAFPYTAEDILLSSTAFDGSSLAPTGTYSTVNLIVLSGGSGSGAKAQVTVVDNIVTNVEITSSGSGYVVGDVLTIPAGFAGGKGASRTFAVLPSMSNGALITESYTVGTNNADVFLSNNDNAYADIQLTGGSGSGAMAKVYVSPTKVTGVEITFGGSGYVVGDELTIPDFASGKGVSRFFTVLNFLTSYTDLDVIGNPSDATSQQNPYSIQLTGCSGPNASATADVTVTLSKVTQIVITASNGCFAGDDLTIPASSIGSTSTARSFKLQLYNPFAAGTGSIKSITVTNAGRGHLAGDVLQFDNNFFSYSGLRAELKIPPLPPFQPTNQPNPQSPVDNSFESRNPLITSAATDITLCDRGTYKTQQGIGYCSPCEDGYFAEHEGSSQCLVWPEGSRGNRESLTPCPTGKYKDKSGDYDCVTCPQGTYARVTGSASCTLVPAGSKAVENGQSSGSDDITDCLAGTYSAIGNKGDCTPCPKGYYQGGVGKSSCEIAPAGKIARVVQYPGTGARPKATDESGATLVEGCPNGSYKSSAGPSNCIPVPGGYQGVTEISGSVWADPPLVAVDAQACPDGYYDNNGDGEGDCKKVGAGRNGVNSNGEWVPSGAILDALCLDGSYNAEGRGPCIDVSPGHFGDNDGGSWLSPGKGATQQKACLDGKYNKDGDGPCLEVADGRFGSIDGYVHAKSGATQQVNCPAGSFNEVGDGPCIEAEPGYVATVTNPALATVNDPAQAHLAAVSSGTGLTATTPARFQTPCSAGFFKPLPGAGHCTKAKPGFYTSVLEKAQNDDIYDKYTVFGATQVTPCAAGLYKVDAGAGECTSKCPAGKSTNGLVGQFSKTACVSCETGKYAFGEGNGICTDCPKGKYSDHVGQAICTPCLAGHYEPETGAKLCPTLCPAGTSTNDLMGQAQCTACAVGMFAHEVGSAHCEECPLGYHQSSTGEVGCVACAVGTAANVTGSENCVTCAPGTYANFVGTTSCYEVERTVPDSKDITSTISIMVAMFVLVVMIAFTYYHRATIFGNSSVEAAKVGAYATPAAAAASAASADAVANRA